MILANHRETHYKIVRAVDATAPSYSDVIASLAVHRL